MEFRGRGGGLASATFLGEKSWKISTILDCYSHGKLEIKILVNILPPKNCSPLKMTFYLFHNNNKYMRNNVEQYC